MKYTRCSLLREDVGVTFLGGCEPKVKEEGARFCYSMPFEIRSENVNMNNPLVQ